MVLYVIEFQSPDCKEWATWTDNQDRIMVFKSLKSAKAEIKKADYLEGQNFKFEYWKAKLVD